MTVAIVAFKAGVAFGLPHDLADKLYAVEQACFIKDARWSRRDFMKELRLRDLWLALDGQSGPMMGFLMATPRGHVTTVDVLPRYQGQGAGTALLRAAEEHWAASGVRLARLQVRQNNPAQVLYFRLGWRVTRVRRNYTRDGSTSLVMTKELR